MLVGSPGTARGSLAAVPLTLQSETTQIRKPTIDHKASLCIGR